ncbi:metal-sensitive transcriptional regulator [Streptomyces sp. NPDC002776]
MHGYTANKEDVLKRLRRIEGQSRGLQRLVEEDTYCIDVRTQVSATTTALQSFALTMMGDHLQSCVADAIAQGGDQAQGKITEAPQATARMVRS